MQQKENLSKVAANSQPKQRRGAQESSLLILGNGINPGPPGHGLSISPTGEGGKAWT